MNTSPPPIKKKPAASAAAPAWMADIGLIRKAAITFGLTLLGAVLLVGTSHWFQQTESTALDQAQQQRNASIRRSDEIANARLQIRDFQTRFLQLRELGLIGAERRLDWIEAIRNSQSARQLAPVSYAIDAQLPFAVEAGFSAGDYQLRGSRMTIKLDLLHEMDLLNLLDDLRQRGFFGVQDCIIERAAMAPQQGQDGAAAGAGPAPLAASCTLNWLTLDSAAAGSAP